jgi:tryptophan synthase alpha chain
MTRITDTFTSLRAKGKKGFVAYITAGDPSLAATVEMVRCLEDVGVDIVELGIPFSDPLADGRVNQESAARALASGATLYRVLDRIAEIRRRSDIPLVAYTYMNPVYALGFDQVVKRAAAAGLDGLLVLDLPVEEQSKYALTLKKQGLNNICLVTPTSPNERIRRIVKVGTGFVYCVSREGVTGVQKKLSAGAAALVERTHRLTGLPVALGFGISTPEVAREAARAADAIVVGSGIVDRFHRAPHNAAGRRAAARWVGTLVSAVKEI